MKNSLLILFYLMSCNTHAEVIPAERIKEGKQLAFERSKGNCLACHVIEDGEMPGNLGPPLKATQSRFDSRKQLRKQIWDATEFNPQTSMPPFGKNKILTEQEIDIVTDYIWSLP